jgi:hypothetical protein
VPADAPINPNVNAAIPKKSRLIALLNYNKFAMLLLDAHAYKRLREHAAPLIKLQDLQGLNNEIH